MKSIESKLILEKWFYSNKKKPYPTKEEIEELALKAKLTVSQVSEWMKNERRNFDKKMSKEENKISTEN